MAWPFALPCDTSQGMFATVVLKLVFSSITKTIWDERGTWASAEKARNNPKMKITATRKWRRAGNAGLDFMRSTIHPNETDTVWQSALEARAKTPRCVFLPNINNRLFLVRAVLTRADRKHRLVRPLSIRSAGVSAESTRFATGNRTAYAQRIRPDRPQSTASRTAWRLGLSRAETGKQPATH